MWLWSTLTFAAPPVVACVDVQVQVPAEPETVRRPTGFQWEGLRPLATLTDGRTLLVRGAGLEGLSRAALKRQHEEDGPDRVMQIVVLDHEDRLRDVVTMPRGTVLEAVAAPDGGLVIARTQQAVTVLEYVGPDGVWRGTTSLAENPQGDKDWRRGNVIRENAEPRIAAFGDGQVVLWSAGQGSAINLQDGTTTGREEFWPQGLVRVFDKRGERGELLIVDRQQRLSWYNLSMERVLTEDCAGCRVTTLGPPWIDTRRDRRVLAEARPTLAAVLQPLGSEVRVVWRGLATSPNEKPLDPILWKPEGPGPWTWMSRAGPADTLAVAANGEDTAWIAVFRPGVARPVWSTRVALAPGERVIADAMDTAVRIRVLSSPEGEPETTTRVGLAWLDGKRTDDVDPQSLDPAVAATLTSPWAEARWADGKILRVDGDPEMARTPPGPTVATFQRCTLGPK